MSDKQERDPIERMVDGYESMLERIHDFIGETEKNVAPVLKDAIQKSREKAVELGELTREEADKLSVYIERDIKEAAHFIADSGQEFRDWVRFDWRLIESRLYELFAGIADQTSVHLKEFAEKAHQAGFYHAGEITGPGTLACTSCGYELHFSKAQEIPPCPKCGGTEFGRITGSDNLSSGIDQGDVDGD